MKSRKTLANNAKIADQKLKDFVLSIVNAEDRQVDGSDDHLFRRYEDFFPTRERDVQLMFMAPTHLKQVRGDLWLGDLEELQRRAVLGRLRNRLREVWLAEYDDVADWRLFVLQREIYFATDVGNKKNKNLHPPALNTPIERAIGWVRRNLLMLHTCRNPKCDRPFFVADKAQQRLCSKTCVEFSQRGHKRRWFRTNKGLWRGEQGSDEHGLEHDEMDTLPISATGTGSAPVQPEVRKKAGTKIAERKRPGREGGEPERTLKQFLHDVANAPENRIDYILKVYAGFFPSKTKTERLVERRAFDPALLTPEKLQPIRQQEIRQAVEELRQGLRSIWSSGDDYTARWRLFNLQDQLDRSTDPEKHGPLAELQPPPVDRLVHQALACMRRNLHMLRTCRNPACQTQPFFIAEKGRQRYCSDVCSRVAQHEFKARWWKEEGPEWRKASRRKQKKLRKAR